MKAKRRSVCQTCRDRKLGCDGKQPACSQCLLTGRICDGYPNDWTFVPQRPPRKSGGSKSTLNNLNSPSLSTFQLHGRPLTSDIAKLVKHGYLPEVLGTLGHLRHEEPQICGAWVEVLPLLPWLAYDASVLSKATRALATLIGSQKRKLPHEFDVESPQRYHDAVHTLRRQISAKRVSLELMPAIMCLALVELMIPNSVPALKVHLGAIGTLFQSYGPEALQSGIAHRLFLGFRPFIIAEAVRDRQGTFLATETWRDLPFTMTAPSHTQALFSQAAAIPSILQQIDFFAEIHSLESELCLRESVRSLLQVLRDLSSWEISSGPATTFTSSSVHDLELGNINMPHVSHSICFPSISVANGLTHSWAFRIVCLLEIQKLLLRCPNFPEIYDQLAVELDYDDIQAEADRLALLICSSMNYLLQEKMKLFGAVSTLFPAQIAYVWFKRDEPRYESGIHFIRGVVVQLVQKGLQSAPILVLNEDLR